MTETEFIEHCVNNNISKIKECILEHGIDPNIDNGFVFRVACSNGSFELVEFLLNYTTLDPSLKNNEIVGWALMFGYANIVELLKKHPKVIAKSIKYNQNYHTEKDIIFINHHHPELLI